MKSSTSATEFATVPLEPSMIEAALQEAQPNGAVNQRGPHWACTSGHARPHWEHDWFVLEHPTLGKLVFQEAHTGVTVYLRRDGPGGREIGSLKLTPELAEMAAALFAAHEPPMPPDLTPNAPLR